jgi:MFS family permease
MQASSSSNARPKHDDPVSGLRTLQGLVSALSFTVLLTGSNATTPLLPVYRSLLGFSPLVMALTLACYMGVTIVFLTMLSRPAMLRWSPALLQVSLIASISADLSMAVGSEPMTLIGRALTGVGVGLGTGPAAALVVDAFGARGRSVSSTGNLLGAVVGTALSQLAVFTLGGSLAIGTVFHVHAVVCSVLLMCMLFLFRRMRDYNSAAFRGFCGTTLEIRATLIANAVQLTNGSIAWIALSASITFLPSCFEEYGMGLVSSLGIVVLLSCCAACQIGCKQLATITPMLNGFDALLTGLILTLVGLFADLQSVSLVGLACIGAGIGISYRMALVVLTNAASATTHGVLSSAYAAITYGAAAVAVTIGGVAGNAFGLHNVVVCILILLVLSCIVAYNRATAVSAPNA